MKLSWHTNKLMEAADEFSGGGGNYENPLDSLLGSESNPEGEEEIPQEEETPAQQTTQLPGFDYSAMAAANKELVQTIMEAQQAKQQVQPSEADFAKLTKHYVPDAKFVEALFDPNATVEQRHQALVNYTNSMNQHFYATLGMVMRSEMDPVQQRLQAYEQQQNAQKEEAFVSTTLKDADLKPYEPLVRQAVQVLKNSGFKPQGSTPAQQHASAVSAVKAVVEHNIKMVNPSFKFSNPTQNGSAPTGARGMPRMAAMTSSPSGAPQGRPGKSKNPLDDVWK